MCILESCICEPCIVQACMSGINSLHIKTIAGHCCQYTYLTNLSGGTIYFKDLVYFTGLLQYFGCHGEQGHFTKSSCRIEFVSSKTYTENSNQNTPWFNDFDAMVYLADVFREALPDPRQNGFHEYPLGGCRFTEIRHQPSLGEPLLMTLCNRNTFCQA